MGANYHDSRPPHDYDYHHCDYHASDHSQYLAKNFVVVAHAPQSALRFIRPCIALHTLSSGTHNFFLLALDYLLSIFWGTSVIFCLHRSFLYPEHYIDNEWKDVSAEGSRVLDCTYICNV